MKVLFFTYSPSPYRVDFFEELGKLVNLTVCYEIMPSQDKTKRNKNWYKLENTNFKSVFLNNKRILGRYISLDMIRLLKKENFDIIVFGGYNALTAIITMFYLKIKKIPFFISTDGGFPKINEGKIKKNIKKRLIQMGNYYLSTGPNADKYLNYYGVDTSKIFHYPFTSISENEKINKVISNNERKKIRDNLSINEDFIILFVGQFVYGKGIDILINCSLELTDDVGVYIIGDKPTDELIFSAQKNKNIHFVDYKPKKDLINYLLASDFFVFPTRSDVWGLVVVEALSFGLPVLTTSKCGAGLDLIKNGYNGYIIDNLNKEKLQNQINLILKEKDKIEKMRKNALKSVESYSIEDEAKCHFEIFKKILSINEGKIK